MTPRWRRFGSDAGRFLDFLGQCKGRERATGSGLRVKDAPSLSTGLSDMRNHESESGAIYTEFKKIQAHLSS